MVQPCSEAPPLDEGREWLRQLTQAVAGWSQGDYDRPLPEREPTPDVPPELVELHAGLELARRALRSEQNRELQRETATDALTGLPNRRQFTCLVERMGARLRRHGGTGALLLFDLDGFRNVNDDLGHAAGDQLLTAVAERLAASVRAEDTIARLGGDEFGVLLEGTGLGSVDAPVERLLSAFVMPFPMLGHDLRVSASVGVTAVEVDVEASELIRRADVAMYAAKRSGKARMALFEPVMDKATRGRLRLEGDLRHAVERDELRLHYQPLFDLASGGVMAVEALVRWEHPTRGLLAPGEFIVLAEQTGLIVGIGEWVLQQAAAEHARFRSLSDDGHGVPVQVNVSARQFSDPGLVKAVAANLDRFQIARGGLGIEITESVVLEDSQHTVDVLTRLRDVGAVVSVDDFGTGYSSLTYLRRFPIDVLKLDRSFVEHIADEVEGRAVVRAVIRLGHDLGLTVVAEGVEDEDQLGLLREWGCDAAQGFLLAPPMPAGEIGEFLHHHRPPR